MTCTYSVDTFLLEIHSATNFPGADAAMYVFKTAPSSLPASQCKIRNKSLRSSPCVGLINVGILYIPGHNYYN